MHAMRETPGALETRRSAQILSGQSLGGIAKKQRTRMKFHGFKTACEIAKN